MHRGRLSSGGLPPPPLLPPPGVGVMMMRNYTINLPTPCLWQAPASIQKTQKKTRPAIRRSAWWRARGGRLTLGSQPGG